MARRHDGPYRKITQSHYACDHLFLARLQHTGIFGLDNKRANFIFADLLFRFTTMAQKPQQRFAGTIQ